MLCLGIGAPEPERASLNPGPVALAPDDIHVWRASLDVPGAVFERRLALLSEDELERAAALRGDRQRTRFVAARGLLREVLALYVSVAPAALTFCYTVRGKPGIDGLPGRTGIQFNLSHSGDLVMCAVGRGRRIGIDVEAIRPGIPIHAIARRFFSKAEGSALLQHAGHDLVRAFFGCWTRKEALLKGRGDGLLHSDEPAECESWSLATVPAGVGYHATLAVDGPVAALR